MSYRECRAAIIAILMVILVILMVILSAGAGADGDCEPSPSPSPSPSPTIFRGDKSANTEFAQGLGATLLIGCGAVSLYQGAKNGAWRWPYEWCLQTKPHANPSPVSDDGRVTPDNGAGQ